MSDLFHREVPRSFIDKVFDTMEEANWHTFQVLTKRSSLLTSYLNQRKLKGQEWNQYPKAQTAPAVAVASANRQKDRCWN
jgi:protein gp37